MTRVYNGPERWPSTPAAWGVPTVLNTTCRIALC